MTQKKLMKNDTRIIKTNHTVTGTFLNRLDKIKNGPNVSLESFDDVAEEQIKKGKMLIL